MTMVATSCRWRWSGPPGGSPKRANLSFRQRPQAPATPAPLEFGSIPYLVRVFVDVDRTPAVVVTAYRTSKIDKYGKLDP